MSREAKQGVTHRTIPKGDFLTQPFVHSTPYAVPLLLEYANIAFLLLVQEFVGVPEACLGDRLDLLPSDGLGQIMIHAGVKTTFPISLQCVGCHGAHAGSVGCVINAINFPRGDKSVHYRLLNIQ